MIGGAAVVAGELEGRARARGRIGGLGRDGEHVGEIDLSAAAQRDVDVTILGALAITARPVVTVRPWAAWSVTAYPSSGYFVVLLERKVSVGPAALPGVRVGIQRAVDASRPG